MASYIVAAAVMYLRYQSIDDEPNAGVNLLEYMKQNLKNINAVLRVENVWGIAIFLFIMSYYIYMYAFGPLGIIALILFCALMWYGAQKMNENRFGKGIKRLEENIIKMETLS